MRVMGNERRTGGEFPLKWRAGEWAGRIAADIRGCILVTAGILGWYERDDKIPEITEKRPAVLVQSGVESELYQRWDPGF